MGYRLKLSRKDVEWLLKKMDVCEHHKALEKGDYHYPDFPDSIDSTVHYCFERARTISAIDDCQFCEEWKRKI